MIYFIQDAERSAIKIGVSGDPVARMTQLQVGSHGTLRLLGVMDGDEETEFELHQHFDAYRIRGEWFKAAPILLEFIHANCELVDYPSHDQINPHAWSPFIIPTALILILASLMFTLLWSWAPYWFPSITGVWRDSLRLIVFILIVGIIGRTFWSIFNTARA